MRHGGESGNSDGAAWRVLELAGGQVGWWAAAVGVIEPDQGMEVDEATGLELGDLAEAGLNTSAVSSRLRAWVVRRHSSPA
jgi:hypothetical protein